MCLNANSGELFHKQLHFGFYLLISNTEYIYIIFINLKNKECDPADEKEMNERHLKTSKCWPLSPTKRKGGGD